MHTRQKGFAPILLIILVVVLVAVGAYVVSTRQSTPPVGTPTRNPSPSPIPAPTPNPKPNPSPSPIPIPNPADEKISRKVGEREGAFLIKKINPDSVEGTWWAYQPVMREDDPGAPRTLHIGDDIGYACEGISDKLTSIDFSGQTVTFSKVVGQRPNGGCPICLAEHTLIDTPQGAIAVEDLKEGMAVWTMNENGERISAVVLETAKTPVPSTHQVVHLVLDDGRELFVSPGHPTGDGRTIGELSVGDSLRGATVVTATVVPYPNGYTYDILPSGDTGFYFANGILVGSTLR